MPKVELLQRVLDRAKIDRWDILIIGDGSGTGWRDACGFAGILIDRAFHTRMLVHGGLSAGSVNLAEMMPYLTGLINYHEQYGKRQLKMRSPLQVHIITDSQVTCYHGVAAASATEELPKVSHRPLWAGMRDLGRMGYRIHYHWAARSTSMLNWASDLIAYLARKNIKNIEEEDQLAARARAAIEQVQFVDPATGEGIDIHALNPDVEDHNACPPTSD